MLNFLLIMACAYLVGAWVLSRADRREPPPEPVRRGRHRAHHSPLYYQTH